MWVEFEGNPCGTDEDDCAVRMLCIILDIDWDTAYMMLANMGMMMCKLMNHNAVISAILRQNGFYKRTIPDSCPDCYNVIDFCEDHPNGTYVLGTGRHVVAVIDGDYIDSFDSGNDIPIYYYYRHDEDGDE